MTHAALHARVSIFAKIAVERSLLAASGTALTIRARSRHVREIIWRVPTPPDISRRRDYATQKAGLLLANYTPEKYHGERMEKDFVLDAALCASTTTAANPNRRAVLPESGTKGPIPNPWIGWLLLLKSVKSAPVMKNDGLSGRVISKCTS